MPDTFSQIYVHVVFTVQNRLSLIRSEWQERLYAYMFATIQHRKSKLLAIGGMPDHIHILLGLNPDDSLSDLVGIVKRDSTKWINYQRFVQGRFSWQAGYGAFSYSKSQIPIVIHYIKTQELHHAKRSFIEEYRCTLKNFGVEYEERHIFKPIE